VFKRQMIEKEDEAGPGPSEWKQLKKKRNNKKYKF
jgi:hypothetical protein